MGSYQRPMTVEEAVAALNGGTLAVLAGGTDYYPARVGRPLDDDILDITGIDDLAGIADTGDEIRIGALATWSDLAGADLPGCFDGLKQAALQVGGAQVQNAGTVIGNVCNASPAADGLPNLLALEAVVELTSARGVRRMPVADFVTGNRRTIRQPGELATALLIPRLPDSARSCFLKLGARRYLVISIVMVAGVLTPAEDGTVGDARIAVGSCSAVAQRLSALERALRGQPIGPGLAEIVEAAHLGPLAPIDDMRGTAAYRKDAALTLLRRTVDTLSREAA